MIPLGTRLTLNIFAKGVVHESERAGSVIGTLGEVAIMRLVPNHVRLSDTWMLEKARVKQVALEH